MAKATSKSTAATVPAAAARKKPAAPAAQAASKQKSVTRKAIQPSAPAAPKLVRDRFTMPQPDFDRLAALKTRARALGRPAKKNELLRAALQTLSTLPDETLLLLLDQLEPAKPPKRASSPKSVKPARL